MAEAAVRFAVVGIERFHVFDLVGGLADAGAVEVGQWGPPGPLLDGYREWRPDPAAFELDAARHQSPWGTIHRLAKEHR